MLKLIDIITYKLAGYTFALYLSKVIRVLQAVQITPLADAPQYVCGIINVAGEIIPVYDMRKRCMLPPKELEPSDVFVIVQTALRHSALIVDEILDIKKVPKEIIDFNLDTQGLTKAVLKLNDEVILIHDIDKFLSPEDDALLKEALLKVTHGKTA